MTARNRECRGFTLIELLVVMAILAMLAAFLMSALKTSTWAARKAVCISNLRQVGYGVQGYALDNEGRIPYGPQAPPFTSPAILYPSTGAPTSLLSLHTGDPVGLGLLLRDYLSEQPRVLFCPGSDQAVDALHELAHVGARQAQGSYYYRHGGNTTLFDSANDPFVPEHLQIEDLGLNRNGDPIRALAIDTQFLCPPELATFNVKPRTHHQQAAANVLYADGGVLSHRNDDARFTVSLNGVGQLRQAFSRILEVLERADTDY
jgi:prepilin-type N-terminal cleavage/methylation domain-containing protein/prepilin-type processing-associated H-X9-DG protein